jgi:hypothetical protein
MWTLLWLAALIPGAPFQPDRPSQQPLNDAEARELAARALRYLGTPAQHASSRQQGHLSLRVEVIKPVPNTLRVEMWHKGHLEYSRQECAGWTSEDMVDLQTGTGWHRNNGLVTTLSMKSVRRAQRQWLSGIDILAWLWFPGTEVRDGGTARLPNGESARKILFRPWFGPLTRFYIHPETGEPKGYSATDYDEPRRPENTVLLRDYISLPTGRSWTKCEVYVEGKLSSRETVEKIEFGTSVSDELFRRPPSKDLFAPESVLPASVPFDFVHGYLLVKVKLAEKAEAVFMLDTGAAPCVFTRTLADRIGLKLGDAFTSYSGMGNFATHSSRVPALAVGTAVRRDLPVDVVADDVLARIGAATGQQVEGILGNSFLNAFLPTVDFEKKKLTLQRPDAAPEDGIAMAMFLDRGTPDAEVQIEGGRPLEMTFDTGAPTSWLPPDYAASLPDDRKFWRWSVAMIVLPRVGAGQARLQDVTALTVAGPPGRGPTGMLLMDEDQGIFGSDWLRRFRFSLDYRRQQILLERLPRPGLGKGDWIGVGLWWEKAKRRVRVSHVLPFSPADRAGIQPGDELVAIGDRPASRMSTRAMTVQLWYGEEGTPVHLTVRRQGRLRPLTLRRERLTPSNSF